jgi:hypothetical protein
LPLGPRPPISLVDDNARRLGAMRSTPASERWYLGPILQYMLQRNHARYPYYVLKRPRPCRGPYVRSEGAVCRDYHPSDYFRVRRRRSRSQVGMCHGVRRLWLRSQSNPRSLSPLAADPIPNRLRPRERDLFSFLFLLFFVKIPGHRETLNYFARFCLIT